jgi:hypothetical protein
MKASRNSGSLFLRTARLEISKPACSTKNQSANQRVQRSRSGSILKIDFTTAAAVFR